MAGQRKRRILLRRSGRFDVERHVSLAICESCRLFKRRDNLCLAENKCINDMIKCPIDKQ